MKVEPDLRLVMIVKSFDKQPALITCHRVSFLNVSYHHQLHLIQLTSLSLTHYFPAGWLPECSAECQYHQVEINKTDRAHGV